MPYQLKGIQRKESAYSSGTSFGNDSAAESYTSSAVACMKNGENYIPTQTKDLIKNHETKRLFANYVAYVSACEEQGLCGFDDEKFFKECEDLRAYKTKSSRSVESNATAFIGEPVLTSPHMMSQAAEKTNKSKAISELSVGRIGAVDRPDRIDPANLGDPDYSDYFNTVDPRKSRESQPVTANLISTSVTDSHGFPSEGLQYLQQEATPLVTVMEGSHSKAVPFETTSQFSNDDVSYIQPTTSAGDLEVEIPEAVLIPSEIPMTNTSGNAFDSTNPNSPYTQDEATFLKGMSHMNMLARLDRAKRYAEIINVHSTMDHMDLKVSDNQFFNSLQIESSDINNRWNTQPGAYRGVSKDSAMDARKARFKRSTDEWMGCLIPQLRTNKHKCTNAMLADAEQYKSFNEAV